MKNRKAKILLVRRNAPGVWQWVRLSNRRMGLMKHYGMMDKIAYDCDTTNRQFESLSNHKHHFINGTCVECLKSE